MYLYGMRLVIKEKQLKDLIRLHSENQELTEQGEGEGTPEAGTSSDGEKKTGASKWESGVTRGPGNQIGVTKWSDVVGSKLTRGKANPLSEQVVTPVLNPVVSLMATDAALNDTPYKEYDTPWQAKIKIPNSAEIVLFTPEMDRRRVIAKDHYRVSGDRVYWKIGYDKEIDDDVVELVKQEQLLMSLPDDTVRYFTTEDGKVWNFTITRVGMDNTDRSGIWEIRYKNYHTTDASGKKTAYDYRVYINKSVSTTIIEFFDEYGEIILQVVLSIAVGIATMGQSLWIQALAEFAVNAAFAAKQLLIDKNSFGAALSLIIAVVPFGSIGLRYGFGQSFKALNKYGPELAKAKTLKEAQDIIAGFSESEQILIKKALSLPENTLKQAMEEGTMKIFTKGIKDKTIDIAKIPFLEKTELWQSMFELIGMGSIAVAGIKYKQQMIEKETEEMANLAESLWSPTNGFNTPEFKKWVEETTKKYDQEQPPNVNPENNK